MSDPPELLRAARTAHGQGMSVGFVPTMGALHAGHLSLMKAARDENDLVISSIYVNPSQFGPNEDLSRYPRDLNRDSRLANETGVDILFTPSDATMYPAGVAGQQMWVDPGPLGTKLEGRYRPGHFRGVATVVAKLFGMVEPDRAYFGQKDGQQAAVISRMVRDLNMPVALCVLATVREPDGLALSSRNVYLSRDQRQEAASIHAGLAGATTAFETGERRAGALTDIVEQSLKKGAPSARVEYVAITDAKSLDPIQGDVQDPALISLAVFFGTTRLIDNVILRPKVG